MHALRRAPVAMALAGLVAACGSAPAATPLPVWACGPDPGLSAVNSSMPAPALVALADGTFLAATRTDSMFGVTMMASANGIDWRVAEGPADPAKGFVTDMARNGNTLVAVGGSEVPSLALAFPEPPSYGPMTWRFTDSAWTVASTQPVEIAPTLERVIATRGGFLVVEDRSARILLSPDGVAWSEVIVEPGDESPVASIVEADTSLIAVNDSVDGMPPTIWTSDDGRAWRRVEIGEPPTDFGAVAASGQLVLTTQDSRDEEPAGRMLSTDGGHTWRLLPFDGGNAPDPRAVVVGYDGGFIAAGPTTGFGRAAMDVWTSPDGETWTQSDLPASVSTLPGELVPRRIAIGGGRVVIAAVTAERVMPPAYGYCSGPLPAPSPAP